MKGLAARYPDLVKELTLNNRTVDGPQRARHRDLPERAGEGRQADLPELGVHHAREWPSSEHTIEFAYDLLNSYGTSERTTTLVNTTRTIVVPIVNPDGFNISREAQHSGLSDVVQPVGLRDEAQELPISASTPAQYVGGVCADNPAGRLRGTDPNRNYGGFWGGAGASTAWSDDTYRGDAPFSEPEVQNIRELQSTRSITNLITNHTYSNLVLRPPGVADFGAPLEEPPYKALGARMTSHNGYANLPSYGLYDTTGGTEDWTFWTAGSLRLHLRDRAERVPPAVQQRRRGRVPRSWPGRRRGQGRQPRGLLRDARGDRGHGAALADQRHSSGGSALKIAKTFTTATSPVWSNDFGTDIGAGATFQDTLAYDDDDAAARSSTWNVNPSTRPDGRRPRRARRHRRRRRRTSPLANPAGHPGREHRLPPARRRTRSSRSTSRARPRLDNGRMTVHIEWAEPEERLGRLRLNAAGTVVAQSAAFGDTTEDALMLDPPAGRYTAVIVNYDQVDGPATTTGRAGALREPAPAGRDRRQGGVDDDLHDARRQGRRRRNVVVDRGQTVDVGEVCR